ncbi:MFS transporter [Hwanghaeella sp.]|uniref:MFS transporter n=1 Tax=Hwanghaeella sp. TaxID=2605943 RepID=UPI003CCC3315
MNARNAVACLAFGQTIVWAGMYYLFPALLLRWEDAEGWSKTTLTAAFAGALVMSGLFAPMAGRIIDKGRGAELMAAAAVLGAVMLSLLPMAESIWIFAGIWLVIGIVLACTLYEPCFAIITRTRGAEARRAITMVTLVAGFAGTVSFPINHAVAEAFGWQAAVLTFAALIAFVGAPLLWLGGHHMEQDYRRRSGEGETSHAGHAAADNIRTLGQVVRQPVFLALAVAFSLLWLNHSLMLNHLLPILEDRDIHKDVAVFAASMIGPMQVAGRLAMMAVEKHLSAFAITGAGFVGVVAASACLFFSDLSPTLLVPFVILHGSCYGIMSIMRPVSTREILGSRNFGAISGALALPVQITAALAPFLGSLLWQIGGYDLALLAVVIAGVAAPLSFRLSVALSRRDRIRQEGKALQD